MKKYKYSEITPEQIYNKRRKFIKSIGLSVGSLSLSSIPFLNNAYSQNKTKLTSYEDITTYNNYYEFGTGKGDPFKNSQEFVTKPWSVTIEGEVDNPITLSAEEILSNSTNFAVFLIDTLLSNLLRENPIQGITIDQPSTHLSL